MKPSDTQRHALYLNNEVKGPYTQAEIQALIDSGTLTPDTLCAPEGADANDWKPASQIFTFPPEKKTSQPLPETTGDDRPSLDPALRKKIIHLGLATAATVDTFTPAQATAAVTAHELSRRQDKNKKIWGSLGATLAAFLLGLLFNHTTPGERLGNWISSRFVKESDAHKQQRNRAANELANTRRLWSELNENPLKDPDGRPGAQYFEGRVSLPPQDSQELTFTLDTGKLAELSPSPPRIVYLKQLPPDIKTSLVRQAEIVWKYKNPHTLKHPIPPADLAASWERFKQQEGTATTDFLRDNTQATLADLTPPLRIKGLRPDLLAGILDVDGFTLCLPYKSQEYLLFGNAQRRSISRAEMMEIERYTVTEKRTTGGKPYGTHTQFAGKSYTLKRHTPVWHYLGLTRPGLDTSPTWIRVPEAQYTATEPGTTYTTKELLSHPTYYTPAESTPTSTFSFLEEK
ncbi:MAG: DUF4339 domain-containing protein [Puniceicoccales bacterium]|jgi:hypothetical protein|nr:DUF4339 domain-containing protein [Puniceicoccales bacterium]